MAHDLLTAPPPSGGTLIPSANYTADQIGGPVQLPPGTVGIIVDIDVTVDPESASVVFTIQGQDPASKQWYDLLASAAVAATGHTTLTVHPAVTTVTANVSAAKAVPAVVRVNANHADGDDITYSVGLTATP